MDNISYVAAVGASVVAAITLWWACGRYQTRLARALFSVATIIVGFLVYVLLGVLFVVMRPELARQTGMQLGHGFQTLTIMLAVVTAGILALRGAKAPDKSRAKAATKSADKSRRT